MRDYRATVGWIKLLDDPHLATRPLDTIVADGRHTPLSLAVDLGDEGLRDEIITLNQNADWSSGVFPPGMEILVPRPANKLVVDATPFRCFTMRPIGCRSPVPMPPRLRWRPDGPMMRCIICFGRTRCR